MPDQADIEAKFWKALKSERTLMLGLVGGDEGHSQPMTAQIEGDGPGPLWIFTSNESDLVRDMGGSHAAAVQFVAKDHDLFAALEGELIADNDRAMIDKLWNPFVAAWFEDGKDDPKLQLLRFQPKEGRVWLNGSSLLAGVKMLLGRDPKKDYDDNVADIRPQ